MESNIYLSKLLSIKSGSWHLGSLIGIKIRGMHINDRFWNIMHPTKGQEGGLDLEITYKGKSKVWNILYITQRGRKVLEGCWKLYTHEISFVQYTAQGKS
jgi:hypothetical protein